MSEIEANRAPEGQSVKKERLSFGEFIGRTFFVAICTIAVLYFTKIWIVDTLKETATIKTSAAQEPQQVQGKKSSKDWEKKNIKINWKDAGDYVGAYVTTEGKIVNGYNNGKVCFLNFHEDYKNHLCLVIFANSYKKFPGFPEKYYLGRNIQVEGRVKEYNGRVEIIVDSPDQIKILQ